MARRTERLQEFLRTRVLKVSERGARLTSAPRSDSSLIVSCARLCHSGPNATLRIVSRAPPTCSSSCISASPGPTCARTRAFRPLTRPRTRSPALQPPPSRPQPTLPADPVEPCKSRSAPWLSSRLPGAEMIARYVRARRLPDTRQETARSSEQGKCCTRSRPNVADADERATARPPARSSMTPAARYVLGVGLQVRRLRLLSLPGSIQTNISARWSCRKNRT